MPLYEFQCPSCNTRTEVFVRTVTAEVKTPACPTPRCSGAMQRVVSAFTRHMTEADKLVEAEAKFGKEVDAAMGQSPDIGVHARRYEKLAKDLPPPDYPVH